MVIHATFDWADVPPSVAVIETVAIAADQRPTELEPLNAQISSDALDSLFSHSVVESSSDLSVSFTMACYEVTVHHCGDVVVRAVSSDA